MINKSRISSTQENSIMKTSKQADAQPEAVTKIELGMEGVDEQCNPKNWPLHQKLGSTTIVSLFTFANPVVSSMLAPALADISRDLHAESHVRTVMMLSIFILGYLVGPLIWAPLSELYGRVIVLNIGNLIFLAFNLGCGFARTSSEMIAFRFFTGLGGVASLSVGSGLLSDCWTADQRARAWAFFILMPMIGPSLGPVVAGFIVEKTSWRWIFWSTTIFVGFVQFLGIFLLRETYSPLLHKRHGEKQRKHASTQAMEAESTNKRSKQISQVVEAFKRPVVMLFTQPVLQAMTLYSAFLYGLLSLVLATFAYMWTSIYGKKPGIASLNYFSVTVGLALGELGTAAVQDVYYKSRVKRTAERKGQPEFRLPLLVPEALLLPVGLFWYGWSVQSGIHWIMPDIGVAIVSASITGSSQLVTLYIVDSFTTYTASAVSGLLILRFTAGFAFPLFALDLYAALGWGWGNSLLAFISIGLGIVSAMLLFLFAGKLRATTKSEHSNPLSSDV